MIIQIGARKKGDQVKVCRDRRIKNFLCKKMIADLKEALSGREKPLTISVTIGAREMLDDQQYVGLGIKWMGPIQMSSIGRMEDRSKMRVCNKIKQGRELKRNFKNPQKSVETICL